MRSPFRKLKYYCLIQIDPKIGHEKCGGSEITKPKQILKYEMDNFDDNKVIVK